MARNLKNFVLRERPCQRSPRVQAKVQLQEFREACADRAAEFMDRISGVILIYMTISAPDFFKPCLPHAFSNCIKLALVFYNQSCWEWLAEVLNISPNLEYLVLDFVNIKSIKRRDSPPSLKRFSLDFAKIKSGGRDSLPDLKFFGYDAASIKLREGGDSFHPQEFVSVCLCSQPKTISIKGFKGTPNEIGVAKYLLSYGEILNEVIFSSPSSSP